MYFVNYNDYELIYLVKEGSEQAQNILYQKYNIYITKLASKYYPYGDKRLDLIQEGLMSLYLCIKSFNPNFTISFFSYFTIVLKRNFSKLVQNNYYKKIYSFNEGNYIKENDNSLFPYLQKLSNLWSEEFDVLIYHNCFIGGMNIKMLSEKFNIPYHKLYSRKKVMLKELKKILTNS